MKLILTGITLIMFTLKLLGLIAVSWWVVFAPVWGSILLGIIILLGTMLLAFWR